MAYRYRRRPSPLTDMATPSRRGPWWKPLAIGGIAFVLFSVVYPLFVLNLLAEAEVGFLRPVLEQVLGRHWHRAFLIGTACLLLGAGLSTWKYWRHGALSHRHLEGASLLSRLLARWIT